MPTDLLSRLAAATGLDRELDALIHRAVTAGLADMHVRSDMAPGWLVGGSHEKPVEAPHYTGSLDAAVTLVPDGHIWDVTSTGTSWIMPELSADDHWSAKGATAELALCIAALRARGIE